MKKIEIQNLDNLIQEYIHDTHSEDELDENGLFLSVTLIPILTEFVEYLKERFETKYFE